MISKYHFLLFGLLLLFIINISRSSIVQAVDTASYNEENHHEHEDIPLKIYPKHGSIYSLHRSSLNHPRPNRNSWFRVSTYQHMKQNGGSDEKSAGDNLMRWG